MYTSDKATLDLISLMKQYNVSHVVVSPGVRVAGFVNSIQSDPFFKLYSVFDERSAAYFALGIINEINSPVAIVCTEATASRNYLPAMTEAYYRNLPLLVITTGRWWASEYTYQPQHIDRTVIQNDSYRYKITVTEYFNEVQRSLSLFDINYALYQLCLKIGPVHINLLSASKAPSISVLPHVNKIDFYNHNDITQHLCNQLNLELNEYKRIAVFIGTHDEFSTNIIALINEFVSKFNAVIFHSHESNYSGDNGILVGQLVSLYKINKDDLELLPELVIDLGSICSNDKCSVLFSRAKIWRVSPDGIPRRRYGHVNKEFLIDEQMFFNFLRKIKPNQIVRTYFQNLSKVIKSYTEKLDFDSLNLSADYCTYKLSRYIPDHSVLHLAILNSTLAMNHHLLSKTIRCYSNTGGFGIDGALSTVVGQSVSNKDKLYYLVIGDLAFYYDMNILGNKHIGNNLRILLLNNNIGMTMRFNFSRDKWPNSEEFICASGHNAHKAKGWVESSGKFIYLSAHSKDEFNEQLKLFVSESNDNKSIVFEVFISQQDESGIFTLTHKAKHLR